MIKTGKNIQCKVCKKEFYISKCRFGNKKYCSYECAKEDNFGFKPKTKRCVICNKEFTIISGIKSQKKTCSNECHYELVKQIVRKNTARKKLIIKIKRCKHCNKKFETTACYSKKFCSYDCQYKHYSFTRLGRGNPNYKDGHATKQKFGGRRSIYTTKHFKACSKYRKWFLDKYGYLFCENCGVNKNEANWFEVHHLCFASRYPRHKYLHDFRNLILVCKKCHSEFHGGNVGKILFEKYAKKRKLDELFIHKKIRANGMA